VRGRIETAVPSPLLGVHRQARLDRDRTDLNVTIKDVPTVGAFGVRAAGRRLAKLRSKAADEIERLLSFLDASDLDPDMEPSLGWTIAGSRSFGNNQGDDDLEAEPEHDEEGSDDEPSLGSHELPSGAVSYLQSYAFGHLDVEEQCDDEGFAA
jgi:hypothetical protein